jgi:DNA-directed RNA polymerase specialized sigma24 family protein
VAAKDRDWQNRQHFFALAARAMRHHLIDHARGRPNVMVEPLEKRQNFLPAVGINLNLAITVDRLLNDLAEERPDWVRLVEAKYFLGLTDDEAAEILGRSASPICARRGRTIRRRSRMHGTMCCRSSG